MKKYKVHAVKEFNDLKDGVHRTPENENSIFECDGERYNLLLEYQAVELLGIEDEDSNNADNENLEDEVFNNNIDEDLINQNEELVNDIDEVLTDDNENLEDEELANKKKKK